MCAYELNIMLWCNGPIGDSREFHLHYAIHQYMSKDIAQLGAYHQKRFAEYTEADPDGYGAQACNRLLLTAHSLTEYHYVYLTIRYFMLFCPKAVIGNGLCQRVMAITWMQLREPRSPDRTTLFAESLTLL